jgi:hypothetical protein
MTHPNHKYVQPKSPLEILGVYLTMLRDRFSVADAGFPWRWTSDNANTSVYIEAGASESTGQVDGRPAIYVDRDRIVVPRLIIGDKAEEFLTTGEKQYYTVATGQMAIDCVSSNKGESSILAEIVHSHLLMTGDVLLEFFRFRDFTPLTLGKTQPWDQDDRLYHTRVTSEFSYDIRWKATPVASTVERMALTVTSKPEPGQLENPPNSPFPAMHTVAITSLNRG